MDCLNGDNVFLTPNPYTKKCVRKKEDVVKGKRVG